MRIRLIAALFLTLSSAAHADETRVQVSVMVPVLQRLETQPAVLNLPQITPLDLTAGHLDVREPVRLTVFSNAPWDLSVRRPAQGGESDLASPLRLQWTLGEDGYHDLDEDWTLIASGQGPAEGQVLDLHLRLALAWTSGNPGAYEPRIEYRLAPAGR